MDVVHATIEHIIPRALGGTSDGNNLALAHLECNKRRGRNVEIRPINNPAFLFITERLDRFGKLQPLEVQS